MCKTTSTQTLDAICDPHFLHMPKKVNDTMTRKIHQKVSINPEAAIAFAHRNSLQVRVRKCGRTQLAKPAWE
jgi:hypothetical protein